jgi:hypothetical protein
MACFDPLEFEDLRPLSESDNPSHVPSCFARKCSCATLISEGGP